MAASAMRVRRTRSSTPTFFTSLCAACQWNGIASPSINPLTDTYFRVHSRETAQFPSYRHLEKSIRPILQEGTVQFHWQRRGGIDSADRGVQ